MARACALTKAAEDRAVELQAWLQGHELEEIYVSLAVNGFNSLRRVQKMSREDMDLMQSALDQLNAAEEEYRKRNPAF